MKQTMFLVLLAAFFGLTTDLSAQSANPQDDEATKRRLEYKMSHAKRTIEQPTEVVVQDNKYNHQEKEILKKLNTDAIPAEFPVYKPEYTNEQYTAIMNAWYTSNPALLKKETNTNQQK